MAIGAKGAVVLRILCALALFALGFTGEAFANPSQDPYSAQYQLPDGSYSSLCQPGDLKGSLPHNGAKHCGSCITAAGHAFTPPQIYLAARPVLHLGDAFVRVQIANVNRILSHHVQGRAPPIEL